MKNYGLWEWIPELQTGKRKTEIQVFYLRFQQITAIRLFFAFIDNLKLQLQASSILKTNEEVQILPARHLGWSLLGQSLTGEGWDLHPIICWKTWYFCEWLMGSKPHVGICKSKTFGYLWKSSKKNKQNSFWTMVLAKVVEKISL